MLNCNPDVDGTNFLNHSVLFLSVSAIVFHPFAPESLAHITNTKMSINSCVLLRSIRGYFSFEKVFYKDW